MGLGDGAAAEVLGATATGAWLVGTAGALLVTAWVGRAVVRVGDGLGSAGADDAAAA